ncbi:proton/phosphate symporter, splice variant a [Haematococcus lacustris]
MMQTSDVRDDIEPLVPKPNVRRSGIRGALDWYLAWALPGMGMFSEAYIVFSSGQVGTFQQVMYPTCFVDVVDCDDALVKHVASYILICGIMAGMLLWGFLGDYTGRKWGSRCVSAIMLSGCILLTFSPWAGSPYGYFAYFVTAQTWYGFGVGGEYPMASSSAAERSSTTPELRAYRGRQVVLVFSNQGMGNLICSIVILISMAIFGQTGSVKQMTFTGAQSVLALTYGFGAVACVVMVLYRFIYLHESKLFEEVALIESSIPQQGTQSASVLRRHVVSLRQYWPRQMSASVTWICNDFAFYGNKLQQGLFISLLYPTATPFVKQQWTVLNGFIALLGYYAAAWIIDRKWYGRVRMQNVGFLAMFVFYIIIYGQWENMGAHGAPGAGVQAFQALYYLSSFFNQFGPNATTWLVAGEIFPTDIRSSYHGFAACMGKLGAIIASLWISYIADQRKVFLVSALWGIAGWFFTTVWMPDTTGLELEEYDRMQRYLLEGRFKEYRGEAVNPRHLSLWEIYVLGWHKQYDPVADKKAFEVEVQRLSCIPQAMEEMGRLSKLSKDEFVRLSMAPKV